MQKLIETYLSQVILLFELLSSSDILDNTFSGKGKSYLGISLANFEMLYNRVEGRSRAIYEFCPFLSLLIFLPAFHYEKHLLDFLIICLGAMGSDFL